MLPCRADRDRGSQAHQGNSSDERVSLLCSLADQNSRIASLGDQRRLPVAGTGVRRRCGRCGCMKGEPFFSRLVWLARLEVWQPAWSAGQMRGRQSRSPSPPKREGLSGTGKYEIPRRLPVDSLVRPCKCTPITLQVPGLALRSPAVAAGARLERVLLLQPVGGPSRWAPRGQGLRVNRHPRCVQCTNSTEQHSTAAEQQRSSAAQRSAASSPFGPPADRPLLPSYWAQVKVNLLPPSPSPRLFHASNSARFFSSRPPPLALLPSSHCIRTPLCESRPMVQFQ